MNKNVKIIGCGVSGLTTGIVLLKNKYNVKIITEKLPNETTSAKAAAIWFPYEVKPKEKVNAWSKISYRKFIELSRKANTGVSVVTLTVLIKDLEQAWWKNALPQSELRIARADELPINYPLGYKMNVPLVETQIYLNYLLDEYKRLGGEIVIEKVNNLNNLLNDNQIVINCTGLGSKELVNDTALYPIHGQIIKAETQENINCIVADFAFGEKKDRLAYVIPRKDCLVLGGTAMNFNENIIPNHDISTGIIERCKAIEPQLTDLKIKSVEVGLRPGRPEIRLEREGNLIHNYGHGGGGFTVSWGCAMSVMELIAKN